MRKTCRCEKHRGKSKSREQKRKLWRREPVTGLSGCNKRTFNTDAERWFQATGPIWENLPKAKTHEKSPCLWNQEHESLAHWPGSQRILGTNVGSGEKVSGGKSEPCQASTTQSMGLDSYCLHGWESRYHPEPKDLKSNSGPELAEADVNLPAGMLPHTGLTKPFQKLRHSTNVQTAAETEPLS